MARKAIYEKEFIIDKSLDFIKEKGIDNLSVRELSSYIGCSTQPLFRLYDNMDLFKKDLKKRLDTEYHEFSDKLINKNNRCISFTNCSI